MPSHSFYRTMFRQAFLLLFSTATCTTLAADFKKDIQPILKAQCYKCHSEEAKKEKGGFVFDNLARFAKDIGPGRVIEPGKVTDSHFYETLVLPEDDDAHMPPNKTMGAAEIKKMKEWIEEGAIIGVEKEKSPTADKEKPGSMLPERGTAEKTSSLPPPAPSSVPPPGAPAVGATMQDWTNSEGRVIQATMVRMEGNNVVLQLASGQVYNYPFDKLSSVSQEMARRGGR